MYVQLKKWAVSWQENDREFDLYYDGIGPVAQHIALKGITSMAGELYDPQDYDYEAKHLKNGIEVILHGDRANRRDLMMQITLSDDGPRFLVGTDASANYLVTGTLPMGMGAYQDHHCVRLEGKDDILRSGVGTFAHPGCDTLFAAEKDAALTLHTLGKRSIAFDLKRKQYGFTFQTLHRDYTTHLHFDLQEDFYRRRFHVDYKPLGPAARKETPAGWMSWYAVRFDACEKVILENAKVQKAHLARYGANTVWVDWEWAHRDFTGLDHPGTDMFHPDPIAYPRGMAPVAAEIKAMGFTPALWLGPTCDPTRNEVLEKHPDLILHQKPAWCGQYHLDVTHPAFLSEVLPRMLQNARDWGYEAIKWDELPLCADMQDACREKRFDPQLSTRQALKNAFQKARDMLGDETYMLFCAGEGEREEDLAIGSFDAMRIGGDIFNWDDFLANGLDRIYDTYFYHRNAILCDADNVVIREEFNDMNQARTRATLVSLLGLPFTLGDDLTKLPPERMDILKKCLPSLPAHPMELRRIKRQSLLGMIHTRVDLGYLSWDVATVYNLHGEKKHYTLDPVRDLYKDQGMRFHAYDFWRDEYLGVVEGSCEIELEPYEARVIVLRLIKPHPQFLATTRHVSMGAVDVTAFKWIGAENCIEGVSRVVGGDDYCVLCAAPEGWDIAQEAEELGPGVWKVIFKPQENGEYTWRVYFKKK